MSLTRMTFWATTCVAATLVALFVLPRPLFVPATFAVTGVMVVATYVVGGYTALEKPKFRTLTMGVAVAGLLYAVFYAGNQAIGLLQLPGLGRADEASIYSLIASPSNPLALQVALLGFDAVGYESFFRGVLQKRAQNRWGFGAVPLVALFDSALHLATLNPLWVATTFVADVVWGLNYYYGKDLYSNMGSHFLWDIAIFVVRPIV